MRALQGRMLCARQASKHAPGCMQRVPFCPVDIHLCSSARAMHDADLQARLVHVAARRAAKVRGRAKPGIESRLHVRTNNAPDGDDASR